MANLKKHTIELVKSVKEGEIETEMYWTPAFLQYSYVYEAVDLMEDWAKNPNKKKDKVVIEETADYVVRLYGEQFTKEELLNGLHAPELGERLYEQVRFVAQGEQNDATKKFLAKKR